jgi:hypothetical protein
MEAGKTFEMPTITSFERDELVVETAFTGYPVSLKG